MKNLKLITLLIAALGISFYTKAQFVPNIGDPRLEVKLPDQQGDSLALSSLKGKVVLIDFWASWCMPCRVANKQLVKLYKKYKDQGLVIFGISVDEDVDAWKRAIAKDKITWTQVIDAAGNMGPSVKTWNVTALPANFLINKAGDMVAMDIEGKELEELIRKLLME